MRASRSMCWVVGAVVAAAAANGARAEQGEAALSVFAAGAGGCEWRRVDPVGGGRRVLATLPGRCGGEHVSFDGKGGRAVIWREGARSARQLFLAVPGESVRELPRPEGQIDRAGFDGDALVALTFSEVRVRRDAAGRFVRHAGRRLPFRASIGTPMLVFAQRWDGDKWIELEAAASSGEACDTLGVDALAAARRLSPEGLAGHDAQGDWIAAEDVPGLAELAVPREPGEGWRRVATAAGPIFVWHAAGGDSSPTGLVAALDSDGARALETGGDERSGATLAVRGPFVLIAEDTAGSHARLLDARGGRLLYATGGRATFFPDAVRW